MPDMEKRPATKSQKPEPPKPKKPVRKSRHVFLWLFLLLFLGLGGAAGAIYMGWIPIDPALVAKYNIPLLNPPEPAIVDGAPPQTNFPLVDLDTDKKKDQAPTAPNTAASTGITSVANASPALGVKPPEKKEDIARAKMLSRLGRLYGGMKPDETVAVFNNLDDEQVLAIFTKMEEEQVGKVLAAMEPRRAARLTQLMLKKK